METMLWRVFWTASTMGLATGVRALSSVPAPADDHCQRDGHDGRGARRREVPHSVIILSATWRPPITWGEAHGFPPPPRDGFSFIEGEW